MGLPDENSVVALKDYGSITFHFKEVMDAKGISRNKLASLTGIRFEVADRWYAGDIERMDMDVLARVCYALDCAVGDVMGYDRV